MNMKQVNPKYYLVAAVLCLVFLLGAIYYCYAAVFSKVDSTQYVYFDNDDSLDSVCNKLAPITSSTGLMAFRTMARFTNYTNHIKTGRYAIPTNTSTITIFRHLKNGQQIPVRLTIPESRTMNRLAGTLSHKLMLDSALFATLLHDSSFCAQQGCDTATIPCLFVPDTYEVYWNISLPALMKRMQQENDRFWSAKRQAKADALQLSRLEVSTLASIVEEETANDGEKPMIAGLYLNRLRRGMLLQADPTVKFAQGNFALRRILYAHLEIDNPYNTYKYKGLPPGPIRVPSIAGLDAVLNAKEHTYIYMCAKEDFSGTHNFATTLSEHMRNARRYARALNERGIH